MSWLVRSITNNLRLDDDDDDSCENKHNNIHPDDAIHVISHDNVAVKSTSTLLLPSESFDLEEIDLGDRVVNRIKDGSCIDQSHGDRDGFRDDDDCGGDFNQGRGVREDLSEFRESLTRQIWGVASFLAPPPPPPPPLRSTSFARLDRGRTEAFQASGSEESDDEAQFREIREGIGGMTVNEEEEEDIRRDVVGITEEALAFAQNIAHHPETWLDFPLSEEEEFEDFEISDSQDRHAQAIEHLAPRLAALRRELCPAHLTEGYFWMVYFVLLYSRLNKQDADALSTPRLVKARAMWMQELQKMTMPETDFFARETSHLKENMYFTHDNMDSHRVDGAYLNESEIRKHQCETQPVDLVEDSVIKEDEINRTTKDSCASYRVPLQDFDEDDDDWLEDTSDLEGYDGTTMSLINEEDVSFSDLEDDLDCTIPVKSKSSQKDNTAYSKSSSS